MRMSSSAMKLSIVAILMTSALSNPVEIPILNSEIDPSIDYGNVNHLLDGILFKVNRNLPDYIDMGDLGGPFDFTDCIFLGTANGIHRDGDATLFITGNVAQFNAPLKMTDIGINCTWHYPELFLHGKCDVLSPLANIESGMALLEESGQHPYLTEFLVSNLDPITSHITGLTPALNWLADDIANFILSRADEAITEVIETKVHDLFQDVLDTIIVP